MPYDPVYGQVAVESDTIADDELVFVFRATDPKIAELLRTHESYLAVNKVQGESRDEARKRSEAYLNWAINDFRDTAGVELQRKKATKMEASSEKPLPPEVAPESVKDEQLPKAPLEDTVRTNPPRPRAPKQYNKSGRTDYSTPPKKK